MMEGWEVKKEEVGFEWQECGSRWQWWERRRALLKFASLTLLVVLALLEGVEWCWSWALHKCVERCRGSGSGCGCGCGKVVEAVEGG